MSERDTNEDKSQDDPNESVGRRIEALAQAIQVLAAEVRSRSSAPARPPASSVIRMGAADLDFDGPDGARAMSAVEARRVIDAIDEEAVSGHGPRADLQRMIG